MTQYYPLPFLPEEGGAFHEVPDQDASRPTADLRISHKEVLDGLLPKF